MTSMIARVLLLVTLSLTLSTAWAEDLPYASTDASQRLEQIEGQSQVLQHKLFVARMLQNTDEAKQVSKELKHLQAEEVELRRAKGELPPQ